MSVQIRTPNITATSDRERLQQIQSYLYQMAGQLQWAFDNIQSGGIAVTGSFQQQARTDTGNGIPDNPAGTFASIKNLIIKSADIVEAYSQEITKKLDGMYVAKSDFGTFVETNNRLMEDNEKFHKDTYENQQTILLNMNGLDGQISGLSGRAETLEKNTGDLSTELGELKNDTAILGEDLAELQKQTLTTNAYIKTGLIDYDINDSPIYGLEIGQTNSVDGTNVFDKFARFSSDRLSFFDSNDVEVAYISDYKLYITNAEVTGNLYLSGKFKIYYNGGLAFQWTGGES